MRQDTASKFFRPLLTEGDIQQALAVSPYFLAYLQAKIEAYATALLETDLPYDPDPTKQVAAIVAFERARTFEHPSAQPIILHMPAQMYEHAQMLR